MVRKREKEGRKEDSVRVEDFIKKKKKKYGPHTGCLILFRFKIDLKNDLF